MRAAIIAVLVSLILSFSGGYAKGRLDASRSEAVTTLRKQLANARATISLQTLEMNKMKAAVDLADRRAEATDKSITNIQNKASSYAQSLDKRAGCILSGADAHKLRAVH